MWRHLCLARALAASGILSCSFLGAASAGEPSDPVPAADTPIETVRVLDAEKSGLLAVEVRGAGQDSVRVQLKNRSGKQLRVVLPPGLVASNAVAQPGGGGGGGPGGGGGGFQNMGLGAVGNQAGGFGQFAGRAANSGFQSVAPDAAEGDKAAVIVPVGQTVDFPIPAVCLNFGAPTPTAKNRFRLVDVDDYSTDARVRKSLRALATYGTSLGTAQAAMWHVCNGLSFDELLAKGEQVTNAYEVALAARFVRAIESGTDLNDLATARVFVTIAGDAATAKDAARLAREIDGLRILGLPVRVVARGEVPQASAPVIHLGVSLAASDADKVRGKVVVQAGEGIDSISWTTLGTARLDDLTAGDRLDAATLARAIDGSVAATFVTSKVARRSAGGTTLEIRNRLPFTVAAVTLKAGSSTNSPLVDVAGVGVGPGRTGQATIPAAMGTIDRVVLNGL